MQSDELSAMPRSPGQDYQEAMLLQQEYVCWRAEIKLDPDPRHFLQLARWEEIARQCCGSMLIGRIESDE